MKFSLKMMFPLDIFPFVSSDYCVESIDGFSFKLMIISSSLLIFDEYYLSK